MRFIYISGSPCCSVTVDGEDIMKSVVAITKCKTYENQVLKQKIKEAMDLLGGFDAFLKGKKSVLVKPNLLTDRLPEQGATTHAEFVRAVVQLLKEYGIQDIRVGDSPSGFFKKADEVFEKTGIKAVTQDEQVKLISFYKGRSIDNVLIAEEVLDVDAIINLPKAKTHNMTTITGAVKNMYGAVPGFTKVTYHLDYPHVCDFIDIILKAYQHAKPVLSLMDGIVAMEGDGPANGVLRDMGLIIAGNDGVSVDSVFAHIIGLNPNNVSFLNKAQHKGLGISHLDKIEVCGQVLEDCKVENFALPPMALLAVIPKWMLKIITSIIHFWPEIISSSCKKCRRCIEVCPKEAIREENGLIKIDKGQCIKCFCCQEICPYNAIKVKRSFVARILSKGWNIK